MTRDSMVLFPERCFVDSRKTIQEDVSKMFRRFNMFFFVIQEFQKMFLFPKDVLSQGSSHGVSCEMLIFLLGIGASFFFGQSVV